MCKEIKRRFYRIHTQRDLAPSLSDNNGSWQSACQSPPLCIGLCVVWAVQTGYKSMLFRIRVEHHRNKQAKTFGSQVAESAVWAWLQPPLQHGLRLQCSGPPKENNTARVRTQHSVPFVYCLGRDCLQFQLSVCLLCSTQTEGENNQHYRRASFVSAYVKAQLKE